MEISTIVQELERELKMRKKVYPDWIKHGKIKSAVADFRIRCIGTAIDIIKIYQLEQLELKFKH